MADTVIERLLYRIEADTKQLRSDFAQAQASAQKAGDKIGGSMQNASTKVSASSSKMSSSMASLARAAAAAALAYVTFQAALSGGRAFIRAADAATRMENRLKLVTSSTQELTDVQTKLYNAAQATRAPIEELVNLYARLGLAGQALNTTQQQNITFTKAIGQALTISGATALSARGALIQLSQAMGAGIVRAEEYNSIMEGAPRIMQAVAAGMDRTGGSVAKLRQLVIDGKVSSREFFDAFISQAPVLEAEFSKIEVTVGTSLEVLGNAFIRFASELDEASGVTERITDALAQLRLILDINSAALEKSNDPLEKHKDNLEELSAEYAALEERLSKFKQYPEWMAIWAPKEKPIIIDRMKELRSEIDKTALAINILTTAYEGFDPSLDTKAQQNKAATVAVGGDDPAFAKRMEASRKALDQLREETFRINDQLEQAERISGERRLEDVRAKLKAGTYDKTLAAQMEVEITKQTEAKIKEIRSKAADEQFDIWLDAEDARAERAQELVDLNMKQTEEVRAKAKEEADKQIGYYKDIGESIAFNFLEGARRGKNALELLSDVANTILTEINRNIARSISEMAFPTGGGGGGLGDLFGGLVGGLGSVFGGTGGNVGAGFAGPKIGYAKGGTFPGSLHKYANGGAFSNSVVTGPTRFRAANGAGLMGEAGAEAIMPLARTPDGKLGVQAVGGNGNGGMTVFIDARGADPAAIARLERGFSRLNATIEERAVDSVMKTQLRGGNFSRAF